MDHSVCIIGLGAFIGFLSGIFGVGGSSVATPLLRLLDIPRMIALGSPLPVTLPTALAGGIAYWRRGMVRWQIALWTALGGVPAILAGSYLTILVPGRLLMLLTGIFVCLAGARILRPLEPYEMLNPPPSRSPLFLIVIGSVVGFLSGLLANGGGFLLVPAYLLLCRLSPQETAGTSLVGIALMAIPGTWVHWQLGHIDVGVAMLMAIGVIPSTYLGARVGLRLHATAARRLFGILLVIFGLFFLLRTLYRAEVYGWWN
jgi:uncharacterized protein